MDNRSFTPEKARTAETKLGEPEIVEELSEVSDAEPNENWVETDKDGSVTTVIENCKSPQQPNNHEIITSSELNEELSKITKKPSTTEIKQGLLFSLFSFQHFTKTFQH